jgi:hypothetical protein
MIRFSPHWQTSNASPLDNSPLSEGTVFSKSLDAVDYAVTSMTYSASPTLVLPSAAADIISVTVNGNELDEQYVEIVGTKTLQLSLAHLSIISPTITVELVRTRSLAYNVLRGSLPPGLVMNSSGVISGTIENIIGEGTISFEFTVRCTNGETVKDRSFTIRTTAVQFDTTWVLDDYTQDTDDDLDIDYLVFGTFKRAETIDIPLLWIDADEDTAVVELLDTGLSGDFEEGLPPGIVIENNTLMGTIAPNTIAARYLFKLGFVGQTTNRIYGEIVTEASLAISVVEPQSVVRWITPAGSLGMVSETYECVFGVKAAAGSLTITYDLAPSSGPLPPGIYLNATTGALQGYATHVSSDTTYSFVVRATTTEGYSDRSFSVTVKNRFNTSDVLEVRLGLKAVDSLGVRTQYRSLIHTNIRYRNDDRNFGVPEPFVYLIKGLAGPSLTPAQQGDGTVGIFSENYHDSFPVIVGPHRLAVARDASGTIIYEVIYRPIIDPQAKAGGFSFDSETALEEKVLWPQSGDTLRYIFPKSFRNARLDMVRDLGFATDDTDLQFLPGPDGVEAIPIWMTCEQIKNDPTSVLGFIPALVVGFTKVGQGKALLSHLDDVSVLNIGKQLVFGRFFEFNYLLLVATTFDLDTTTFDNSTLIFDPGAAVG